MPSSKSNDLKVSVSFTNWVLGGSLVLRTSTDSERHHRRVSGRQVVISDVDSNGDEVTVKQVENPIIEKKGKKKDGEKNDDGKKQDGEAEKEKKKCKSCGKDKGCGDVGGKKDGGDKAKKDSGDGEKKSDESKGKSDNSWDSGGGGSCGLTDEQTSKLKEMKAANKSWKEIAAELNASQKDCKEKWKELQNSGKDKPHSGDTGKREEKTGDAVWGSDGDKGGAAADSGGTSNGWDNAGGGGDSGAQSSGWDNDGGPADANGGDESSGWDKVGGDKAADSGEAAQSNGWDNSGAADAGGMEFGGLFDEPSTEPEKSNGSTSKNNTNWSDGGKKQKSKKKDKEVHWEGGSQSQNQNSGGSGWNNGASANKNSNQNTGGSGWHKNDGSSKQSQNQGSGGGGWANSDSNQPPKQQEQHSGCIGRLQPDDIWTKDDCEVLEMLAHRYKEYKWLHIKAGFFNWTGRMISDEMIQKKLQDDGLA